MLSREFFTAILESLKGFSKDSPYLACKLHIYLGEAAAQLLLLLFLSNFIPMLDYHHML